jgi:hypothetical protein
VLVAAALSSTIDVRLCLGVLSVDQTLGDWFSDFCNKYFKP